MTYIGKSIKRVEDKRFLTGLGNYTDDIKMPGMTHAYILRSPYAHAKVNSIDTAAAKAHPGVLAVFVGADIDAAIAGVPCGWQVDFKNGDTMKEPPHPLLVRNKVRHVGDGVAMIIAEDRATARDAADLIEVDYDVLEAVACPKKATEAGAPLVHEDAGAAHVTELSLVNQKVVPNAIEPRSAIGIHDAAYDKYTLYTSTQNPHLIRLLLCAFVLGLPEHKVRVVGPDVGGGFGSKIFHYTEEALVIWASKQIGRPIKWTADRSESFITDAHGRDHVTTVKMGFDKGGKIVGLQSNTYAGMGAYLSSFAPAVPTWLHGTLMQGLYTTPKVNVDVQAVFTNTVAVDAYRGAGRPEATYQLERLMDLAALEMNMDPAELRRINFIPAFDGVKEEGYVTQVALQYILGIGFSTYIEACGIAPSAVVGALGARAGLFESSQVRVQPTGKVSVYTGSHSHGQGHETTFAQVVADRMGIPLDDVEIIHGDLCRR